MVSAEPICRRRFLVEWLLFLGGLLAFGGYIGYSQYQEPMLFAALTLVSVLSVYFRQRQQGIFDRVLHHQQQLLHASEARLHSFFEAIPDALLISNTQGVITMASHQVELLLGYTVDELIGQSIENLVPEGFRAAHAKLRDGFAASPVARRMGRGLTVQARRKDGRVCDVEVSLSRIKTDEGLFFATALRDITERKGIEEKLTKQNSMLSAIIENFPGGVSLLDSDLRLTMHNKQFKNLLNFPDSLFENPVLHFADFIRYNAHRGEYGPGDPEQLIASIVARARQFQPHKFERTRPNGMVLEVSGTPLPNGGFVAIYVDITERRKAEEDLRIAATAFESQEGIVVTDAHSVILRVNRAFTEACGYAEAELVGQTPHILRSGRHSEDFYREMWKSIDHTGGWRGEIWDKRKNGEIYPQWITITAVKNNEGVVTHYIGTHFDITERKKAEERINELAFFDQLTGLPNRTLLLDRLKQAMTASSRSGNYGALLFIDLDNFKTLNDTLGHDMGDMLLKQVAQRLILCVRAGDTVARLGGDEFVVMLAGLSAGEGDAAAQTEGIGEKIRRALSQMYQLHNAVYHSAASIGITLFRGDFPVIDDLMKQADLAMYKSKATGRNALHFFDPEMASAVKERAALENDLRRALDEQQFFLHYQAQVEGKGLVTGAEVLLRWQHPERGMVSPAGFIPLAEEVGLIVPIGHWVLETSCVQLARWSTRPEMAHLTLAVNVSARQFNQADFVDQVLAVLEKTGANPQRLKLELTESLLVENVESVVEKMGALKANGVGFSLDDFGTGYSSLTYLKRLPLDQLKIDQSFIQDVLVDPNDAAIAKTIVVLAQSLGLDVIAEGVETEAQRDFLSSSGCYAYQGYLFSRALPVDGFETLAQRG